MARPFRKPATTYEEQVALLRQRGMDFADEGRAQFYLKHLNYYRLGAYWLPFEADHGSHRFQPGTAFERVLEIYRFDRELRLLILDAIERVEVSVRSLWAYTMATRHGPHAHLDPGLARDRSRWQNDISTLETEVGRSHEVFIEHHRNTYSDRLPPVWASCEVMSLGMLSRWFKNLRPSQTRKLIAETYGVADVVLESWLHHLTVVRNTCAHHSRLWNRRFTVTAKVPRSPARLAAQFTGEPRKLHTTLVLLFALLDVIAPDHSLKGRFLALVSEFQIPTSAMGFPDRWLDAGTWQGPAA